VTAKKAPAKRRSPTRRVTPKAEPVVRLDIACGVNKAEGWTGIDMAADSQADIVHDLFTFPWPIADGSVKEARCSHFVEHIPHWRPGWEKDGWWLFFEEVQRILAPDATIEIWHPYGRSDRAWWDPTHERAVMDTTWYYLDPDWRVNNGGIGHYPTTTNFEVVTIEGVGVPEHIMSRAPDFVQFAQQHYANVYADLHVILRRRP
jgi:hypothetical protein